MPDVTIAIAGAATLVILAGMYFSFEQGRQSGVRATVTEYTKADQEGAEDVTETSRRVLRDLGRVADPIGLLCETGGLRDAECGND